MRIGPSAARQYYKTRLAARDAHKISTDIRPILPIPFSQGAKCPKFRPQSSSNRHIFELQRFIGKQKQICQGAMTGLPSYQIWNGWVPPTPRTVGAMGTPKGKSLKYFIYPPFQRPRPSIAQPMLYHLLGPWLL